MLAPYLLVISILSLFSLSNIVFCSLFLPYFSIFCWIWGNLKKRQCANERLCWFTKQWRRTLGEGRIYTYSRALPSLYSQSKASLSLITRSIFFTHQKQLYSLYRRWLNRQNYSTQRKPLQIPLSYPKQKKSRNQKNGPESPQIKEGKIPESPHIKEGKVESSCKSSSNATAEKE